MKYISELTYFQAKDSPLIDKFYYKEGNKTLCIIHADKDWNMYGEVIDPFNIPVDMLTPKFSELTQYQCERLIIRQLPPPTRTDVLERFNIKEMYYDELMYTTRLVNMLDLYWIAWSENDKAEDYHPRFNKEILAERDKYILHIYDSDYEETPIYQPDFSIENRLEYRKPNEELLKSLENTVFTGKI